MEAIIIIVIIGIIWLVLHQNKTSTKFNNALKLIKKGKYHDAEKILLKITKKHPIAVTRLSECYYLIAEDQKKKKNNLVAFKTYKKVIKCKTLLTNTSDKSSFHRIAEVASYEISKLQFEAIPYRADKKTINDLRTILDYINQSEYSDYMKTKVLINQYKQKIARLLFVIGQHEEINGNYQDAKKHYSDSLTFSRNSEKLVYFNTKGRIEICNLKLNISADLTNVYYIDLADPRICSDFYFRYTIALLQDRKYSESEDYIGQLMGSNNMEVKQIEQICKNEKIKAATGEIEVINSLIRQINNNSIDQLSELYDTIANKGDELDAIIPGIKYDLEEIRPSILNRMVLWCNKNQNFGKVLNLITNYPEFFDSPALMKNIGNTCLGFLKNNILDEKNFKIVIALFLTSAYSDKVMLSSLEETLWDDEYTFSLIDSIGSSYKFHTDIPENVNYDEITDSNISIGSSQKYLINQFEKLINEQELESNFSNQVIDFYENEKQAIESIIKIIPEEIIFATPYFAKKYKIETKILDLLESDFKNYNNEESLEAGIPYLINNSHSVINEYRTAKKTIESLIDLIIEKNLPEFTKKITADQKKLLNRYESLLETLGIKLVDAFKELINNHNADETVLELIGKSISISPLKDKIIYLYCGYAASLCITKINADTMSVFRGLQIMSNAYSLSPNDSRVCSNLVALIRMNILKLFDADRRSRTKVYSLLDKIYSDMSQTFRHNAGELIEARDDFLGNLPADARIAIMNGVDLNEHGLVVKKALEYLTKLGGDP
jgi:hypothetical protein